MRRLVILPLIAAAGCAVHDPDCNYTGVPDAWCEDPAAPVGISPPPPVDPPATETKRPNNGSGNGSEGSSPGKGKGANDDE